MKVEQEAHVFRVTISDQEYTRLTNEMLSMDTVKGGKFDSDSDFYPTVFCLLTSMLRHPDD